MRKALILSYDGTAFHGWQKQPNALTVQESIENVFSQLNSNKRVEVVGCGRTDTGVHAKQFVAHIDLTEEILLQKDLLYKLNIMLSDGIAIRTIEDVPEDFHARFDAKNRSYQYFFHQKKDPFKKGYSWYCPQTLDFDNMQEAASYLPGKKDFTSFSKLHTQVNNNICDIKSAHFKIEKEGFVFEITANRFLRNMVRAIVGTLVEIGEGKLDPKEINHIIQAKDRGSAGKSAPAHGLFLSQIDYPDFSSGDYFE